MKTKILIGKLKVPFIESFGDYHNIYDRRDELAQYFPSVRCKEIAFSDGMYYGVFYPFGEMPTKIEIKKMLEEIGFKHEDVEIN